VINIGIHSRIFLLLLVDIAGLSGVLLLVHIAGLCAATKGFFLFACIPFVFFVFAFPSALPSLFLLPLGWEGAGGGVSQELGKGYSMDNCSG